MVTKHLSQSQEKSQTLGLRQMKQVKTPTPNHVGDSANEQISAAFLHSSAVGIKIDVAHRSPGTQSAHVDLLAVRMDHIHQIRVARVQTILRSVVLEQRAGRVQT